MELKTIPCRAKKDIFWIHLKKTTIFCQFWSQGECIGTASFGSQSFWWFIIDMCETWRCPGGTRPVGQFSPLLIDSCLQSFQLLAILTLAWHFALFAFNLMFCLAKESHMETQFINFLFWWQPVRHLNIELLFEANGFKLGFKTKIAHYWHNFFGPFHNLS